MVVRRRSARQRERVSDAYATAALCDCLVFVVDADRQLRKPDPRVERLLLEYRKQIDQFRNDTSSDGEEEGEGTSTVLPFSAYDVH